MKAPRKRASVLVALLLSIGSCSDQAPDPAAKWMQDWKAETVDGASLPKSFVFGGGTVTVQGQTLLVLSKASGIWDIEATPISYAGQEFITWFATGDLLTVTRDDKQPTGRTPIQLVYSLRSDGKLETTYDGHVYVLAKQ